MKRMTYVAVPALLVLLVFSLPASTVFADSIKLPDDLIIKPIGPAIGPFLKDPCLGALVTLQLDKANITFSTPTGDTDSYIVTYTYPLQYGGVTVAYLKAEFNRMVVGPSGDPINFFTSNDTFYFPDSLVFFGKRFYDGDIGGSFYKGGGVIQKVMAVDGEVLDFKLRYVFDPEDEEVCFFTY